MVFNASSLTQYYHIVGNDVWRFVRKAFSTGSFNPSLAETLIALIPKMDNPTSIKEFRPISLYNTIYKIISNVLVNRIRPLLCSLIGPFQSSFLSGRGITDNAIILQQIMHNMCVEKAYDNVRWSFLENCLYDFGFVRWSFLENYLYDFGFPPTICKLIMHCVSSSSLSLIWNGKRLPSFVPSRGIM